MRRMHRIGENPLARMKRVSTLGRQWLLRLATRSRLRFVAPRFQQRQIFNRPGPSEDCIVKGGIVVRAGNLGHGERKKNNVPQCGRRYSAAREFFLDPGILEKTRRKEFTRCSRPVERSGNAARKTLPERAPADFQLRLSCAGKMDDRRGRTGLAEKVERISSLARGHEPLSISRGGWVPRTCKRT